MTSAHVLIFITKALVVHYLPTLTRFPPVSPLSGGLRGVDEKQRLKPASGDCLVAVEAIWLELYQDFLCEPLANCDHLHGSQTSCRHKT
ncbi:hypothetical protein CgunFtcFv8_019502 [Champsocephalus gunnari]|uniref:Secreted protein n=1 Tax=Champsocephalus gunnari TaxID=52237 RepID=A0AAN8DJI9_CHAGU|nr:hypothetical protein CgunFtcFv8_019502 [Champsocephalus gunnari]